LTAYVYDGTNLMGRAYPSNNFALVYSNKLSITNHSIIAVVTNAYGLSKRATNQIIISPDRAPTNVVLLAPMTSTNTPAAVDLQATAIDRDGDPISLVFSDGPAPVATNTT